MTEKDEMKAWVQFAAAAINGIVESDLRDEYLVEIAPVRASRIASAMLGQLRIAVESGEFQHDPRPNIPRGT